MQLFELHSGPYSIKISEKGAEMVSWKYHQTELLWQAHPNIWPRHAPVLFPFVGQTRNLKFKHQGQTYPMSRHGFARDSIFTHKSASNPNTLKFELCSTPDSLSIYPFEFCLTIGYTFFENTLQIDYSVKNIGSEEMYFALGGHPGFQIPNPTDNNYVKIHSIRNVLYRSLLNNGLIDVHQEKKAVYGKEIKLTSELFNNDAIIFLEQNINGLELFCERNSYSIQVYGNNIPYWGIWSAKGCMDFICLEPWWGHSDDTHAEEDLNMKKSLMKLEPGKTKFFTYYIRHQLH